MTRLLAAVVISLAVLAASGSAEAASPSGGTASKKQSSSSRSSGRSHQPKKVPGRTAEPSAQLSEPSGVSGSNLAKELDSKGQVDPVSGLGIVNPVCEELDQIRDRRTRLSCEANGSPESDYPTSNYGFDVFISTGVTHPVGSFTAAFVTILNGIWLGMIFVLKLTLELLGLAFGLNPFAKGGTMGEISTSVGRLYAQLTDPWLSTLITCGGIWFAYRGLLRRDLASGIGGTIAGIAMLVLGLWVVHQPRESVGQLADMANQVAISAISAPQSGSVNRPVGTYAESMSGTWDRLVEVPFAGLDFSDVNWALGRPPPEAVERADKWFCQDVGALSMIAAYQWLGSEKANEECAAFARKRYGKPRRVIDLYLRSSPGSPAREALWNYFDGEERFKPKVAAQGGDGALTRLSMLALFAIGLLGSILLLAWLALRLFTQAAIAFVLLLGAPIALFFPLLGDSGRRAFKTWGLTLVGAVLAKVIYAAFLSIVLLGISILGRSDGSGGSATGFLLASAFTWSVFLKRTAVIGLLSIGESGRGGERGFGLGGIAGLTAGRKLTRGAGESLRGVARRGADLHRQRRSLGVEATRETARSSLQGSARALADQRYAEAKQTVERFEAPASGRGAESRDQLRPPGSGERDKVVDPSTDRSAAGDGPGSAPTRERYEAARSLVVRVKRNEDRLGERWSDRDLQGFAQKDRELLESSSEPKDHAHRAGISRSSFEELRGPERERAEVEIEKARKRDLARLSVSEPGSRATDRPRLAVERVRQGLDGSNSERRSELQRLRRERRSSEHLAPRRNLSRGA
jgi:hypothetical protein